MDSYSFEKKDRENMSKKLDVMSLYDIMYLKNNFNTTHKTFSN